MRNIFRLTKFELINNLKFIILILIFFIFVSIFAFFYEAKLQKQHLYKTNIDELNKARNLIEGNFNQTHKIINSMIKEIKKNHLDKAYINSIMKNYKTNPNLSNELSWTVFSWTDENNQIIVDTKYEIMAEPFDLSIRDYINFTQKDFGKFFLGKPIFGSTSKKFMIPGGVGAAINDKYIGSMAIGFEIEVLKNLTKYQIQNDFVKFTLIGTSNEVIFTNKNRNYKNSSNKLSSKILEAIKSNNEETFYANLLNKSDDIFIIKKSQKYPFVFLIEYDKIEAHKRFIQSYLEKMKLYSLISLIFAAFFLSCKPYFT
jgi:hypothetical protein